jgi:hypothetical protein
VNPFIATRELDSIAIIQQGQQLVKKGPILTSVFTGS